MKKVFSFFLLACFLVSSCTFNVEVLTPETHNPEPVTPGTSHLTPSLTQMAASPVATTSATAPAWTQSPVPTSPGPLFFNARTASSREDANRTSSFPAGTKQVYALWDYQNMREGLLVRREWYWNSQLWLTREETWDFKKYGANGTIRDISIYDNETGLNSGVYQLRLYIDNTPQPIGNEINASSGITFTIGQEDASAGYGSLDNQWGVEVYGEKRILLKNVLTGSSTEIYSAREVPYVAWFNDSKHFLFVDRDRAAQQPGTGIGIRDDLWLVDVPSGARRLLYSSDTSFAGRGGPAPSPDGRYIASLEGSGYGDACMKDSRLIFFELAGDFNSIKPIQQTEFSGLPVFNGSWIYPVEDGYWQEDSYLVQLDGTCNADKSQLGRYTFDLPNRTASLATQQRVPGDLGVGMIHGTVTDAASGAPIQNAAVTCEQHSYTSSSPCSGTVQTNGDGAFAFSNVFFHDTDSIKLTVQAPGYQTQEISQSAFTTNDWQANISLNKLLT